MARQLVFRRAAVLEREGIERLHDLVLLAVLALERRGRGQEPFELGTICTEITADRVSQRISMIAMISIRLASRCSVFGGTLMRRAAAVCSFSSLRISVDGGLVISARSASSMGITAVVNSAYIHLQKAEIRLAVYPQALRTQTPQNGQRRSAGRVSLLQSMGYTFRATQSPVVKDGKSSCSVAESLYSFSCSVIQSSGCFLAAACPVRGPKLFS